MYRHFALAGVFSLLLAGITPAHAGNCPKREVVVDRLTDKYSEQLTAGGLQSSRTATTALEVWTSPIPGTFTVMLTNANAVSCIVASGTDWHAEPAVIARQGVEG